jgi:RHS repeat-associated protein
MKKVCLPKRIQAVLLVLGLLFSGLIYGNNETPYTNLLLGDSIKVGKSLMVQDTIFFNPSLRPKVLRTNMVNNVISLKIGNSSLFALPDSFKVDVTVRIIYIDKNDIQDSVVSKTLSVDYYKNRGYKSKDIFILSDAYSVEVKILDVVVTHAAASSVLHALELENRLQIDRDYIMNPVSGSTMNCTTNAVQHVDKDVNFILSDGELKVFWAGNMAIEKYDLEWTYIDSSALANGRYNISGQLSPNLIFKNNATRISTTSNEYNIPLLYDGSGSLFFRVRGTQEDNNGEIIATAWSSSYTNGLGRHDFKGHERRLNWQASTTFAEEAKRKSVVQYFDGGLRNRQTVTKDNTSGTTVVAETLYDQQGRPVIQVLPAPTLSKLIAYNPLFNVADINSREYDKGIYDTLTSLADYCAQGAPAMNTVSGTALYYSSANTQKNLSFNQYIPESNGYVFTETRYAQDNTGRINMQSGVGATHQLGSGRETKYYYGTPEQTDLDALFGTEAGDASHYQKNMVRDANGQYSVSYVDMHGRTVATALAGDSAQGISRLNSYRDSIQTEYLLNNTNNIISGNTITSNKGLLVTKAGNHTFNYNLAADSLSLADCKDQNICYDCLYDLEITITDDCNNQLLGGEPLVIRKSNFKMYEIDTTCNMVVPVDTSFVRWLEPGSYNITKKLSISEYGMQYYRDSLFLPHNTCKTYEDFLEEQKAIVRAEMNCVSEPESIQYEYQSYRREMEMDMYPQVGQYASNEADRKCYSIFNLVENSYRKSTLNYVDEEGQPALVMNRAGQLVKPQELSQEEFIENFQRSWAKALILLHPEYKLLEAYEAYATSLQWDKDFTETETYADAITKGYLNPTGNTTTAPASAFPNVTPDPLFSGYASSNTAKTAIQASLFTYKNISSPNTNLSLWGLATALAKCEGNGLDTLNRSCVIEWNGTGKPFHNTLLCTGELDMAWKMFRSQYQTIKHNWLINYIKSSNTDVILNAECSRHFNTANELLTNAGYTQTGSDKAKVEAALLQTYEDNCKSYATRWWTQLQQGCYTYTTADSAIVIKYLVNVCKEGSDTDRPLGSSTVKPGSTYRFKSFEEVIRFYNDSTGRSTDINCNSYLLDKPLPYEQSVLTVEKAIVQKPEACECEKVEEYYQKYLPRKNEYSNFSAFMAQVYQTKISQPALDSLRSLCSGEISCNYISKPLPLPIVFQCGSVSEACVECDVVKNLYDSFSVKFPGVVPMMEETDTTQQKINQVFATYLNHELGFTKTTQEYLQFIQDCDSVASTVNCADTSLSRILQDYNRLFKNGSISTLDCKNGFANYFNQQKGTSYQYNQIDSLYDNSCAASLKEKLACFDNTVCDKFGGLIESFKEIRKPLAEGKIIDGKRITDCAEELIKGFNALLEVRLNPSNPQFTDAFCKDPNSWTELTKLHGVKKTYNPNDSMYHVILPLSLGCSQLNMTSEYKADLLANTVSASDFCTTNIDTSYLSRKYYAVNMRDVGTGVGLIWSFKNSSAYAYYGVSSPLPKYLPVENNTYDNHTIGILLWKVPETITDYTEYMANRWSYPTVNMNELKSIKNLRFDQRLVPTAYGSVTDLNNIGLLQVTAEYRNGTVDTLHFVAGYEGTHYVRYKEAIDTNLYQSDCEAAFAYYYNQQKGTSYTFNQLDTLYRSGCGKPLAGQLGCTPEESCDSLQLLVNQFKEIRKPLAEGKIIDNKRITDCAEELVKGFNALLEVRLNTSNPQFTNDFCKDPNPLWEPTRFHGVKKSYYPGDSLYHVILPLSLGCSQLDMAPTYKADLLANNVLASDFCTTNIDTAYLSKKYYGVTMRDIVDGVRLIWSYKNSEAYAYYGASSPLNKYLPPENTSYDNHTLNIKVVKVPSTITNYTQYMANRASFPEVYMNDLKSIKDLRFDTRLAPANYSAETDSLNIGLLQVTAEYKNGNVDTLHFSALYEGSYYLKYKEVIDSSLYQSDCKAAFAYYYNQQRGTSYTFGQLDTLYRSNCGKSLAGQLGCAPPEESCDSLQLLVNQFKEIRKPLAEGKIIDNKRITDCAEELVKGFNALLEVRLNTSNPQFTNDFCKDPNPLWEPTRFHGVKKSYYPGDSLYHVILPLSLGCSQLDMAPTYKADLLANNVLASDFCTTNIDTAYLSKKYYGVTMRDIVDGVRLIWSYKNSEAYAYYGASSPLNKYLPPENTSYDNHTLNIKVVKVPSTITNYTQYMANRASFPEVYMNDLKSIKDLRFDTRLAPANYSAETDSLNIGLLQVTAEYKNGNVDTLHFSALYEGSYYLKYKEVIDSSLYQSDCKKAFTYFYNQRRGTHYTVAQVDSIYDGSCGGYFNPCNNRSPVAPLLLCGKKATNEPFVFDQGDPCEDSTNIAIVRATEMYRLYTDSLKNAFAEAYQQKCLQAANREVFTVTHPVSEYHYTLYYYDQAGNLVKTIPPEGAYPNRDLTWLNDVKVKRALKQRKVPVHILATTYRYNSLNQVVSQKSPDGGYSEFWYDRLGRLVVSRNAKQLAEGKYSYTLYDFLGRITEVGQKKQVTAMTQAIARDPAALYDWLRYYYTPPGESTSIAEQVTATFYDRPDYSALLTTPIPVRQRAYTLRNRVSYTRVYDYLGFSLRGSGSPIYSDYNQATTYCYDIHGNVDTLLQDYRTGIMAANGDNRFKVMTYTYDLISGKVNQVHYQPGLPDQLYHRYEYDAENRITDVYTSNHKRMIGNTSLEEHEAFYQYYKHGPLARTVLGQEQVQGIDYAYTLQGWLKGVNSDTLLDSDANYLVEGGANRYVARDAYRFSLNYYNGEYQPVGTAVQGVFPGHSAYMGSEYRPLYNGNISSMVVGIPKLGDTKLYNYQYDQLNRLVKMDMWQGYSVSNGWSGITKTNDYKERISYDGNGNILTYLRNGNPSAGKPELMDQMTYHYNRDVNQRLTNNKLRHVKDAIGSSNYTTDIDNQVAENYSYDAIGNLIADQAENINNISWNVYGKIIQINKTETPRNNVETIRYDYDVAGNRVSKWVKKFGETTGKYTQYVRDASGNVMAIYTGVGAAGTGSVGLTLTEHHLYGSSRIGIWNKEVDMTVSETPGTVLSLNFERGKKFFELSNHLGNVLATISDKKLAVDITSDGVVDYYTADVVTATDYAPFGMGLTGRNYPIGLSTNEGGSNNECTQVNITCAQLNSLLSAFETTHGAYTPDKLGDFTAYLNNQTGMSQTTAQIQEALKTCGLYTYEANFSQSTLAVDIPSDVSLNPGLSDFSIEAWSKYEGSGYGMIASKFSQSVTFDCEGGSSPGYSLFTAYARIYLFVCDNTGQTKQIATTNQYDFTGWRHITAVRAGNDIADWKIYLDGVSVPIQSAGSCEFTTGNITNGEPLVVGGRYLSNAITEYYTGKIKGVNLYKRAVGASEVEARYNNGCPDLDLPANTTDLVLSLRLDEGEGSAPVNQVTNSTVGSFVRTDNNVPLWVGKRSTTCSDEIANTLALTECVFSNNTGSSLTEGGYRYGFNGKEMDNSTANNSYDFGARIYDGRLGRWLSTDPLAAKYTSYSPYNYCINSPLSIIDYDGRDIIIVTTSGNFVLAKETLLKTPSGKQLWQKYAKSKKHDIYITIGAAPSGANGSTFYGFQYEKFGTYIENGKITIKSPTASKAFNSMNGVDVSKSKGRHISVVLLSEENFNEMNVNSLKENADLATDRTFFSNEIKYSLAEIIFHEIKAHIDLHSPNAKNPAQADHTAYGKEYSRVFDKTYLPAKGTPAETIMNELKKVFDKEIEEQKKEKDIEVEKMVERFEKNNPKGKSE